MASTEVLLPLMGEGVNEATVSSWLAKEGRQVQKDAPILEVSTDKVDTEIPAPASGFLVKLLVQEGDTVEVNQVLAVIADSADESVSVGASTPAAASPAPAAAPAASTEAAPAAPAPAANGSVKSSPLVRKIAAEKGIDLSQVAGTGLHGRITKKDVLAYQETASQAPAAAAPAPVAAPKPAAPAPAPAQNHGVVHPRLSTTTDDEGKEFLEGLKFNASQ